MYVSRPSEKSLRSTADRIDTVGSPERGSTALDPDVKSDFRDQSGKAMTVARRDSFLYAMDEC